MGSVYFRDLVLPIIPAPLGKHLPHSSASAEDDSEGEASIPEPLSQAALVTWSPHLPESRALFQEG